MNEALTPDQFAELKEERARQIREMSDEEFAMLKQKMHQTWKTLSRQEQGRLMAQRRRILVSATGIETGDRA